MKKLSIIIFACISVLTVILFVVFNFAVYPKKYKNFVVTYAEKFGVEPALVYAIIKVESNFDKEAMSSAGALGLMQIMPSTAKWISGELGENFEKDDLFDEETNIRFGCFYLKYLYSKLKTTGAVICAYNAGETAALLWVNESGEIDESKITYSETKNYFKKVTSYYETYKNSQIFK